MAMRGFLSYWLLPVFSSLVWLGMLLGMLLHWIVNTHRRRYPSMAANASVAYISDIGAGELKPLFIAGSCVTVVTLDLAFFAERWLRHQGRLVPNQSAGEKILVCLSIVFAVAGAAGLILLSVFDVLHHKNLHDGFLLLFIGGYMLSAVFTCWEYQRLGISMFHPWVPRNPLAKHRRQNQTTTERRGRLFLLQSPVACLADPSIPENRQHRILRSSFWVKLAFILVELVLAVVFASTSFTRNRNVAAVFEWVIAFIFTFYIASFIIDLRPAVRTRRPSARFDKPDKVEMGLRTYGDADADADARAYVNGQADGHGHAAAREYSAHGAGRNAQNF
ncbi:hypothetical protein UVI_02022070 [Ustilaginoidea virens]|uniref:CWH43-like N-terminal domain-containing protein n=1 Tax=Ustilaginoidea virens TaxID=1159556 RepID=A0A1B5L0U4_USTVR|nr:hypothetical protein UVI_02022070 [Ustilaginoidea virens]